LAYLSDELPTDVVQAAIRLDTENRYAASLDHTIWFHRPLHADNWHLYEFTCHNFVGGRGLAIGHVFAADGVHVATVAQEVLMRGRRGEQTAGHAS
jgi:acyl-CoA thioesterase-2